MIKEKRLQHILGLLQNQEMVTCDFLSGQLNVSGDTIRRRLPLNTVLKVITNNHVLIPILSEIDILLSAPVHLNDLLIPLMLDHGSPSLIVNVTSGGAYIPQVFAPVYSACKAALHSYTMVLRQALSETNCRVAELIPPAVQTGLAGPGQNHGVLTTDFCDAVL